MPGTPRAAMCISPPNLLLHHVAAPPIPHLTRRLEGICLERWGRMEGQLAACYQGIQLRPPPAELRRWFRAARQAVG